MVYEGRLRPRSRHPIRRLRYRELVGAEQTNTEYNIVFDDANHKFHSIEPENRNKGFLTDRLYRAISGA